MWGDLRDGDALGFLCLIREISEIRGCFISSIYFASGKWKA
jgi:hypothetical protein